MNSSFVNRLIFLTNATNQHGVHSPFVYSFITKGLYIKKKYSSLKVINILLKTIAYFQVKNIAIVADNSEVDTIISKEFSTVKIDNNSADLIYIDDINFIDLEHIATKNSNLHNDSIVFINGIHKNLGYWNSLIANKKITVSINLFYCGILFFRKEQVKEDFKIRI